MNFESSDKPLKWTLLSAILAKDVPDHLFRLIRGQYICSNRPAFVHRGLLPVEINVAIRAKIIRQFPTQEAINHAADLFVGCFHIFYCHVDFLSHKNSICSFVPIIAGPPIIVQIVSFGRMIMNRMDASMSVL